MTDEELSKCLRAVSIYIEQHLAIPCAISPMRLLWLIERALKCSALEKELDDKDANP